MNRLFLLMCVATTAGATGSLEGIVTVATGGAHVVALTSDGRVYAWGDNSRGQLGQGTTTGTVRKPVAVTALPGRASAVAAGSTFSVALLEDGSVWTWGSTSIQIEPTPTKVSLSKPALAVSAGAAHVVVLLEDGQVVGWGDDSAGALCSVGSVSAPTSLGVSEVMEIQTTPRATVLRTMNGQTIRCGQALRDVVATVRTR